MSAANALGPVLPTPSSSHWISWRTSLCATLRATCGRANRQSCRFVMAHLAALIPRPRANLTRFHGVFAGAPDRPNSKHRALVTPARRGKGNMRQESSKTDDCVPASRHAAMTWAQRLKRVFNIDISTCDACGGAVKIIASIENPVVIKQILTHLERRAGPKEFNPLPESSAPPQPDLFG